MGERGDDRLEFRLYQALSHNSHRNLLRASASSPCEFDGVPMSVAGIRNTLTHPHISNVKLLSLSNLRARPCCVLSPFAATNSKKGFAT